MQQDTTKSVYKQFTTDLVTRCEKYKKRLEELMEKCRVFRIVDELEEEMLKYIEGNKEINIEQIIKKSKSDVPKGLGLDEKCRKI